MFDSLADRMKQDQNKEVNATERAIRAIVDDRHCCGVFGGSTLSLRLLE